MKYIFSYKKSDPVFIVMVLLSIAIILICGGCAANQPQKIVTKYDDFVSIYDKKTGVYTFELRAPAAEFGSPVIIDNSFDYEPEFDLLKKE